MSVTADPAAVFNLLNDDTDNADTFNDWVLHLFLLQYDFVFYLFKFSLQGLFLGSGFGFGFICICHSQFHSNIHPSMYLNIYFTKNHLLVYKQLKSTLLSDYNRNTFAG